jgi:hypothetical protein
MNKWCGNTTTHGAHSYAFGTGTANCPGWSQNASVDGYKIGDYVIVSFATEGTIIPIQEAALGQRGRDPDSGRHGATSGAYRQYKARTST